MTDEEITHRLDKIAGEIQEEIGQDYLYSRFLPDARQYYVLVSYIEMFRSMAVAVDRTELPKSDDACKRLLVERTDAQLEEMVGKIQDLQDKLKELAWGETE